MTPEDLETLARSAYGTGRWRAALARDLETDERTVRRWRTGKHRIRNVTERAIRDVCQRRELARQMGGTGT